MNAVWLLPYNEGGVRFLPSQERCDIDTTLQTESTKSEGVMRQLLVMHFTLNAQDPSPVCVRRTLVFVRMN